jgi:hypothetical protein
MICLVGRKPRFQIAIMILEMLEKEYPHCLGYKELEKEVNRRCKGKKPSTATVAKYLNMLSGRESQYSLFIYKRVQRFAGWTKERISNNLYTGHTVFASVYT